MRIDHIEYDHDGELLVPVGSLGMIQSIFPSADLTYEVGYFHRHKVLEGTSVRHAQMNLQDVLEALGTIPGFRVIRARNYTVRIGGYVRYGTELLYVIEPPVEERQRYTRKRAPRRELTF